MLLVLFETTEIVTLGQKPNEVDQYDKVLIQSSQMCYILGAIQDAVP
jgi:hypothetical protein